jgi:hypothetical protein
MSAQKLSVLAPRVKYLPSVLFLLLCGVLTEQSASSATYVAPPAWLNVDGNNGAGDLVHTVHIQTVYARSLFTNTGPMLIQEIRYRPSATYGRAFTSTIPNLQLNLSTTSVNPEALSTTFANNRGPNDTLVFQGPLTLSSRFTGPAGGPKAFDMIIPLQNAFLYDPSAGNLVIEVRNFSNNQVSHLDVVGVTGDGAGRMFSVNAAATTGAADTGSDIVQLVYTVPSSAPIITGHPQSQSVPLEWTVTFSVGVYGTPPLSYQSSFNGTNLANATNSSLVLNSVSFANEGTYGVVVTNIFGQAISSNAVLDVYEFTAAPTVREPPGPSTRKSPLAISEIMYHPLTNFVQPNERLHFIEVYNSQPWDENIGGHSIITFDGPRTGVYIFPPNTLLRGNGYVVVAIQPETIRAKYGATNVLGPANLALSINSGAIQLRNRQGAVLVGIVYSDAPPWPIAADGKGHSLVLARPSLGEVDPRAWAQSDSIGGSPGREDRVGFEPLASVVLNEWSAHTDVPFRDALELYNYSNTQVDLSGAYLTDSADANKFRIPNGTVIGPRGFVSFDDTVFGFGLFAGGETIFFVNSNQTRVIDVVTFKGQSNNISSGRWPDGGQFHYGLTTPTFGLPNSLPMHYAVVINELMYNPVSGSNDLEYVELYNRSSAPVDLSAWTFTSGFNYTFPSNSPLMQPGAYFVVGRNPTNLIAVYPNLNTNNTFGPYVGTLANSGERVTLAAADYVVSIRNGVSVVEKVDVVVSEVTYDDGGRWGEWSDGGGASLELIDPEANTRLPSNWADSNDTGESQWTSIEFNGPPSESLGTNVNDAVILMLEGIGECLVDEVEVRADGGPNLVGNGGFESGLSGWSFQGSHDFSTLENVGFVGTRSLHLRAGSRGDNQSNRILSAPFARAVPPNTQRISIRVKAKWLRGYPELLVRLHGSSTEAFGMMALPRRLGTPGMANSRRVPNAGPAIYQVKHSPPLPAANEPVVVSAHANDPHGIATITLRYRIDPSTSYASVTLRDDGTDGDTIANDGIYAGTMPGRPAGTMVAFYLEGRDFPGATATFPTDVFPPPGLTRCWPNDALTRECLVRWGEPQMPGDFATYHLWLTSANSNRWHKRDAMNNTSMDGTFIYNNSRIIYNAIPLYSGSPWHRTNSTTGPAGPNRVDYEMNFPDDDLLLGAKDFILNNPGNPDILTISDLSAVAEQTVYQIMDAMGLIRNNRRYIHFFVNGNQRSTAHERPGNFIFEDSQQPNGDMVLQWFPDNPIGPLYKVEDWFEFYTNGFDIAANNDADLTRRTIMVNGEPTLVPGPYRFMFRPRFVAVGQSANDFSDIFTLIDLVSPPENPNFPMVDPFCFGLIADWEQWMRMFATQRAIGNFDTYGWIRGKNTYLYKPADGLFQHMPWDIDYTLGLGRPWNAPLFESNDPRVTAMFNTPEIVRAYWRAFAELVNGPFTNTRLNPFIDGRVATLVTNNVNIDHNAVAAIKTYISQRNGFLQEQLATVAATFTVDTLLDFSTTDSLLVVTGTAPVQVKSIALNGVMYPVTWINVSNFVMRIVLQPGLSTNVLQALDRLGTSIGGMTHTFIVDYIGLPVDPLGAIVINEIMYAPAVPSAQFIEIVNRSEHIFDLSGWLLAGADFVFPVGSIMTNGQTIVLVRDKPAFQYAHRGVPVFNVFSTNLSANEQILLLISPDNQLIDAVRYEGVAPWPRVVPGASLQLIDNAQDNSRPSNWAVDLVKLATPGKPNSVAATLPPYDPLWLNELQTESLDGPLDNFGEREPWLELYNSGPIPLNLDGYFLANNYAGNLTQWQFPAGATIGPEERRLVWLDGEANESTFADVHTSFRSDHSGQLGLVRIVDSQPQITDYLTWRYLNVNLSYGDFPEGQIIFRAKMPDTTPGNPNTRRQLTVLVNEWVSVSPTLRGLRDPADGLSDDWFELYNAESFPVDLGGFHLTDSLGNPTQFSIPTTEEFVIPPDGFMLVWADAQPDQNAPGRELHTNFRLSNGGDGLALLAPNGTVIDNLIFGPQSPDISEGRFGDGSNLRFFMPRFTPRGFNSITTHNSPPRLPLVADQLGVPGQTLDVALAAVDPDDHTLIYMLDAGPSGSQVLPTGIFRWLVPTNQAFGDYPITVRVTDNGSPPRTATATFTVTVGWSRYAATIYEVASVNGQSTLTFTTIPGHTYRIQYADNLAAPVWTQIHRDFVAANSSASVTDFVTVSKRFYRVLWLE